MSDHPPQQPQGQPQQQPPQPQAYQQPHIGQQGPPPAGGPQEPKQSWWNKKLWKLPVWAWILIGLVTLCLIGILNPPDETDESSAAATTSQTAGATSAPPAAASDTQAPATDPPAATEAPEPESTTTTLEKGDASAQLACTHFRNVVTDAANGILTDAELREKLKEVYDDARVSESPGIADAATRLLAGATHGSLTEEDVLAFSDACASNGF